MLNVRNLTVKYGENVAVNSVSFTVDEGEIFGLLGPNGAGKSTLLNIVAGIIQPTSGEILFKGKNKQEKGLIPYANLEL